MLKRQSFGRTWSEINNKETMIISDNYIEYDCFDYPYAEFKDKTILYASEIYAYTSSFNSSALLTKQGNVFFVRRVYEGELLSFCIRNHIDKVIMQDNWFLILEEFLDTEIAAKEKERTYILLERAGISWTLCDHIRRVLAPLMIEYNFKSCLWEWCYLGMYDLLMAAQGNLIKAKIRIESQQIDELYNYAVKIALMQSDSKDDL